MRTAIIIPARFASTRFPGKPLHPLAGKAMIQHVWERCRQSQLAERVIIATDDARIFSACAAFGGEAVMTREDHPSGTDRIIEVMDHFPDLDAALNVQGDEPLISPSLMDHLIAALDRDPTLDMVTAAVPMEDLVRMGDPNVVKVVTAADGTALYFSRAPVPWDRGAGRPAARFLWHKGIYGYRRGFLDRYRHWPVSPLEELEQLEQLRALENGARIHVVETNDPSPGVDTPAQAAEVERLLLSGDG